MPLENFWVKLQAEYPKNNCRTFIKGEERVLTQLEFSGYVLPEKVLSEAAKVLLETESATKLQNPQLVLITILKTKTNLSQSVVH
ncbi:hypothetical protein T05_12938 [Trichinella murrelli]|uniref:Uncharacterized protein n=1 Tax=Trichinella murrelli TaxID=144512 RepID=A0A0V0T3U6_9BILA|nr:hypothetical protein T05_12938 [Trichinella murrelli]